MSINKLMFSKNLIKAACLLMLDSNKMDQAGRTVLYLSLLSCELSLKAALECAGYKPNELKKISHKLDVLLKKVGFCIMKNTGYKASAIRSIVVVPGTANGTVGTMLKAELLGSSLYPSEIRYDDIIKHYPPDMMLKCAKIVNDWCEKHKNDLTRS